MKTTQNTQTYTITLTEIKPDCDNPTQLELDFIAELRRDYLATIPAAADPEIYAEIIAELDDDDFADSITFEFNVASRHHSGLYVMISGDRSGDQYDLESAINDYGQPIIDFIADTCRLLNVPFYPNAD